MVRVTAQNSPRLSVAALLATKPGHRPRLIYHTHSGRRRGGRNGGQRNLTKHDIAELTVLVKTRLKRMQYRSGLLAGFLASTGLDLGSFRNSNP